MTISLPVALKLDARACLVVGNGAEALRRVTALLSAGAKVTLVAAQPIFDLLSLAEGEAIVLHERDYVAEDLDDKWLAVLCERDAALAERIGADAEQRRVYFCAIDQPTHNSFAHLGVARSGPVFVAVGSEGKAPALTARLAAEFQRLLDDASFMNFVERLVRARKTTAPEQRGAVLNRLAKKLTLRGQFVIDED